LPVLKFHTALGPNSLLIRWALELFTLEARWPGREADHSPPSKAKVKNEWINISTTSILYFVMACTGTTVLLRKCELAYNGKVHIVWKSEDKLISFACYPFSRTETTFYCYFNRSG
jgi:hypothetical protein